MLSFHDNPKLSLLACSHGTGAVLVVSTTVYSILHLIEKSSFGSCSIYLNSKTWVSTLSGKVLAKVWGLLIYFSPMSIMSLFKWLGSLANILFFTFVTGYLKWKYVVVHKYMAVEEIQLTPTRTHLGNYYYCWAWISG